MLKETGLPSENARITELATFCRLRHGLGMHFASDG
jgi:hypothetical protein